MRNLLGKLLSAGEGRKLKILEEKVATVNSLEPEVSQLSDAELKAKTAEFKKRLGDGESLDDLLPEAFAVVREVAKRTLNMRHFDVQIMGGVVLYEGGIAEMATGEGKTLVATLPVYLNALESKGVHVVTVNDYLAKRDTQWMGPIYHFLGLSVGVIQHETAYLYDPSYPATDVRMRSLSPVERREVYLADITYGTNNEFGFDYLRDNMTTFLEERVQRDFHYAIVDEVDSILIDEARTPLIISGPSERAADWYRAFDQIARRFKEKRDYEIDEKTRTVAITDEGQKRVEQALNIDNLWDQPNSADLDGYLRQALRAHTLFKRDVDYLVKDGEVVIIDEFTGRLMFGRRYSEGLHQAIEAREKVSIREENQTLATVTLQNYFRLYEKLAGMTGTAATEADEFRHIYGLQVVVIPPNKELRRDELSDVIYKTEEAKFKAIVEEIVRRHKQDQPLLVGTISVEKSEKLSKMLKKRGVSHQVLNAKYHEREAEIIAQAGRKEAVMVATHMAGRGVDILLGGNLEGLAQQELLKQGINPLKASEEQKREVLEKMEKLCQREHKDVVSLGGLHVLGTERHEARRIDNQLRGRAGRQGDPGSSQFFLSLEDDLMKMLGSDRIAGLMDRLRLPEDQPIEHRLVTRTIETAQKQVESQHFEMRKHLLEYDDVMNTQRGVIYNQRHQVLSDGEFHEQVEGIIEEVVRSAVETYAPSGVHPEEWDLDGLFTYIGQLFPLDLSKEKLDIVSLTPQDLSQELIDSAAQAYKEREKEIGAEGMRELERQVMLHVIDTKWREHLYEMDYLQEGIGLRAVGQRDPLVEYKKEAYDMFQGLTHSIKEDFVRYIFHVQVVKEAAPEPRLVEVASGGEGGGEASRQPRKRKKIGRNDPCPCGSGKKYKKCCGR